MLPAKAATIDYTALSTACNFYSNYGYQQIETPWLIDEEFMLSTSPDGTRGCAYMTDGMEYLVCSAEQGFMQLAFRGELQSQKKYYSVSPCFRNEQEDVLHVKQFMKLELFGYADNKNAAHEFVHHFLEDARELFRHKFSVETSVVCTDIGVDLVNKNGYIELGSYGVRNYGGMHCAYGTGLALPRITQVRGGHGLS